MAEMRIRIFLTVLFVLLATRAFALFFCDGDSQTMRRPPLVAGEPWCEILTARKGQATVYDFATSGATTGAYAYNGVAYGTNNVLARLTQHFALGNGNCMALMVGINDAYKVYPWLPPPISASDSKANLHSIILQHKVYHQTEITIFLNTPFWGTQPSSDFPAYVRGIREEAAADGVPVVDSYTVDNLDRCWLYPLGSPDALACAAFYNPGDSQHVGATVNQHIADLCLLPQYANACACRP